MKIWFDFTNSPHVGFFKQMINELKQEGHEIIVTCRPLGNTIQLLDLHKIQYNIIGTHYGKANISKVFGFPIRLVQLYLFLKSNRPDIAIAQASYYLPVVAKMLGIPSIYTNDNERAKGNIPAFICAKKIYIPEFLDKRRISSILVRKNKITQYPGVKEGIYLWNKYLNFTRNPKSSQKIYIRMEPSLAQYYNGGSYFLDEIIIKLKDKFKIVILPREKDQIIHYSDEKFKGIEVLEKPMAFDDIACDCLIFIGAGGTMTREMAVIGIPTISVYQDELLMVDKYLVKIGLMKHFKNLTVELLLEQLNEVSMNKFPDRKLLESGKEAYSLLKSSLLQY